VSAPHRLELKGELTIRTVGERKPTLVDAVEAAEQAGATVLELDLSEVVELDTAGLQLLLLAQREAANSGCVLRLAVMSQVVQDVLAIAQLGAGLDPELVGAPSTTTDAGESLS
jgi:anti-sigma B factor antagonist